MELPRFGRELGQLGSFCPLGLQEDEAGEVDSAEEARLGGKAAGTGNSGLAVDDRNSTKPLLTRKTGRAA